MVVVVVVAVDVDVDGVGVVGGGSGVGVDVVVDGVASLLLMIQMVILGLCSASGVLGFTLGEPKTP